MWNALTALCAFLLGSIPFGYLIVRLGQRRDIRAEGSGNIGATNVARVAGRGAGLLTLVLDVAKGYGAVELARYASGQNIRWMMLAALLVVVGHIFTPWLGFRGGKGVATAAGALFPVAPWAILTAIIVWMLVVIFWRYVSLGSVSAAAVTPLLIYFLYERGFAPPWPVTLGSVTISLLVIARHRQNLRRILNGEESRISLRH